LVNGHWATLLGAWLVAMTRYGVDTWRVALFVSTYNWRTHPDDRANLTLFACFRYTQGPLHGA